MVGGLLLFGLLALAILVGSLLGWIGFFKASRLEADVLRLKRQLAEQQRLQQAERARTSQAESGPPSLDETDELPRPVMPPTEPAPSEPARPSSAEPSPSERAPQPARSATPPRTTVIAGAQPSIVEKLVDNIRDNWMIWLGGISVALAGIFLVGYGIEMGLIGPRARIVAAVLAGLILHGIAEWLRRKTGSAHPAFAALAGGASITLYAAIVAALELYSLISPGTAFVLLAIVSFVTMALALLHGPMLAIIGILGAYVVPILVLEGTGDMLIKLAYSWIVTTAALVLTRFVYRPWLWGGMLIGALGWWLLSLTTNEADGYRGIYLAAIVYVVLAVPVVDWLLRQQPDEGAPGTDRLPVGEKWFVQPVQVAVLLTGLAQAVSIANLGFGGLAESLIAWAPLNVVVIWAAGHREPLKFGPWLLLITQWFAWLFAALDTPFGPARLVGLDRYGGMPFLAFAAAMALLFSAGTAFAVRGRAFSHLSSSLVWLAPPLWLALAYLLVTDLSVAWEWSIVTLALGFGYIFISQIRLNRSASDGSAIWLILGAHFAYSLAAAMMFRDATLTLALAAQLISLAWLNRRFHLPALPWIVKGVLGLVVVRLTLNPWLLTYPADQHWSLWTYGGSLVCCAIAAVNTPVSVELRKWLEAASLHLLVLFLGAEVRYWLYDGRVFIDELTLTETAIYTSLWGGLALAYFYRARVSEHLQHYYVACSRILIVLALGAYALSLTVLNPMWSSEAVGTTRIFNLLLLAYGAPVLVAIAAYYFYETRFRTHAAVVAAAGLFIFVSIEIRHLWQGALDLDLPTSNGELYTYSAVWMVMAVVTMLAATRLGSRDGYRAGTALLFVVIAKIFLIDMSDLEGLLRVASFMGLGLALLGLAYLYQHMTKRA